MQNVFFFLMAIMANMVMAAFPSPLAIRGDAPPPDGEGLTWCTKQDDKTCTVGQYNPLPATGHRFLYSGRKTYHFRTCDRLLTQTLGIHQNFDTGAINAYIFDKDCKYSTINPARLPVLV